MTDPTITKVRRAIDESRNRGGMRVGMPKVTIDAADAERLCILAESAISAPRVPEGESVTFWVVYDATTDKKYIKKNATTGALAIFDYEHEAKAASIRQPGTSFVKITYIKQGE